MYCVSCKSSTSLAGARYCARCGAPLESPLWREATPGASRPAADDLGDDPKPCPQCGRLNARTHQHCVYCGSRLMPEGLGAVPDEAAQARAAERVAEARQALEEGQKDRARSAAEQAVALNPRSAEAHALLAEILRMDGSLAGALQEMSAAVRCAPEDGDLARRLAELREEQERALEPMLRGLDRPLPEPSRSPKRQPRPRRDPVALEVPAWARALGLIGGLMLLLGILPRIPVLAGLFGRLVWGLGLLVNVLAAVWVYHDARSYGKPASVALLWAAVVLFTSLIGLLVYLLVTRARR